ncbi:hypothetical protein MUP77_19655 [Candidatus Bathyarchaeota archaeon]|nr:hypothetical protein [Candidatus Bathyarchaeota archaeon]
MPTTPRLLPPSVINQPQIFGKETPIIQTRIVNGGTSIIQERSMPAETPVVASDQTTASDEDAARAAFEQALLEAKSKATLDFEASLGTNVASISEPSTTQIGLDEKATEARTQFQADLEQKRQEALTSIASEKSSALSDIAARKAAAQQGFEAQRAGGAKAWSSKVSSSIAAYNREALIKGESQLMPQQYWAYKKAQQQQYELLSSADRASFEEDLQAWESEQQGKVSAWESTQRTNVEGSASSQLGAFENTIAQWRQDSLDKASVDFTMAVASYKAEANQAFEQNLSSWESGERSKFETETLPAWKASLSQVSDSVKEVAPPSAANPLQKWANDIVLGLQGEANKIVLNPITTQVASVAFIGGLLALSAIAPPSIPLTAPLILKSAASGVVLSEGISLVSTGKPMPVEEILPTAAFGAGMTALSVESLVGFSKLEQTGVSVVSSKLGRAGIQGLISGGMSYVSSVGSLEEAGKGFAFGAALSLGMEYIGQPLIEEIKAKLPSKLGGVTRLESSLPTLGKSGDLVESFQSTEGIEKLGGRTLRVVADVTENPVGTTGNLDDMINEYVGRRVPTGHGTVTPEGFNLSEGGETLLKGFPKEASWTRTKYELLHLYSALGSPEDVNIYGGYAGIGQGFSEETVKIKVAGRPTALVTTSTYIDESFLPATGENIDDYLTRTSRLSGKTGLAQETLLGLSAERQAVTPASYVRGGEQLLGSKFVSEGSIGKFQIKETPSGFLGKIPIIRSMLSRYTDISVVLGRFEPADVADLGSSSKVLDVPEYSKGLGSTRNISVGSAAVQLLPSVLSKPSQPVSSVASSVPSTPIDVSSFTRSLSKPSISSGLLSTPKVSSKPPTISKPTLGVPSLTTLVEPSISSKPSYPKFTFTPSPSKPSSQSKPSPSILLQQLGSPEQRTFPRRKLSKPLLWDKQLLTYPVRRETSMGRLMGTKGFLSESLLGSSKSRKPLAPSKSQSLLGRSTLGGSMVSSLLGSAKSRKKTTRRR